MKRHIEIAKALADQNRLRILKLLEGRELCVCQMLPVIGGPASGLSRNLSILKEAKLLDAHKDGRWVRYRLNRDSSDDVGRQILSLVADWLNDDHQVITDRTELENILKLSLEEICIKDRKPTAKKRVLFLCTSNSARSQMAEALVNHDLGDRFEAYSAGTAPKPPHSLALKALAEIGIDHSGARSKSLEEFAGQPFDHVITLCNDANETCPVFFGGVKRAHIGFEDPARATGSEEENLNGFRRIRDDIRKTIEAYLLSPEEHAASEPDQRGPGDHTGR